MNNAPYNMENVNYDTISGIYVRPRSKRVFLHRPGDVCIVEARPDFTFLIKDAITPSGENPLAGYGFLFGNNRQPVDIDTVAKSFTNGSIPILSQSILMDGVLYKLSSLCANQQLYLRITAENTHPTTSRPVVLFFSTIQTSMSKLYEHPNEDYVPYKPDNRPWLDPLDTELIDGRLMYAGSVRAMVSNVKGFTVSSVSQQRGKLTCLRANLCPGESCQAEWLIPYPLIDSEGQESEVDVQCENVYTDTLTYYNELLNRGTKLHTPDPMINTKFNTLRLSSLQMFGSKPGSDCYYPGQGGMNSFGTVYGMETSCWLPVLGRLGYGTEVGRAMDYLLTTQYNSPGPEGDISDPAGSFRPHIHWMCETGAVLGILCSHALYTQDKEWFNSAARKLEAACEFIIRQRTRTQEMFEPNEAGYGLLPKGRPHDWPDFGQFLFSDAYTWKGINLAAKTFTAFDHPYGEKLTGEAADYKACILNSFHKSIYPHPQEKGRLWFSTEVHTPAGVEVGAYGGDGPICLVDAGILPADDPLIRQIEWDAIQRGFMTQLFTNIMKGMEDEKLASIQRNHARGDYDLIYVTFSEFMWYKTFMERGERDRALTYLYSTLAYATTYDLGITHERFSPQLPWLLPWQPNASANGRILEMITSSICYQNDNHLYLLAGVPQSWLDGAIRLEDYAIIGGRINIKTERKQDELIVGVNIDRVMPAVLPTTITYCLPEGWMPVSSNISPVKDKKGWYRGQLSLNNKMIFKQMS